MPTNAPLLRLRRSALYLPASNPRAVNKARSIPCDVVILDLEDAVAAADKVDARAAAVAALRQGGFGRREVVIRANGLSTPWGAEDLAAVASAGPGAVLAPKISAPDDVLAVRRIVGDAVPLWAMIETRAALLRLSQIGAASAAAGVEAWVIGSNDLAKEMQCAHSATREPLIAMLTSCVVAARAHGLTILDGIYNDISDQAGFAQQCAQGARLGFDGKTLIHPTQVDPANAAFAPDPDAVAAARTIAAAFEAPGNATADVLEVAGRRVERARFEEARRLLSLADLIPAADGP